MNKRESTYWVVVETPNGEIRYIEARSHAAVKGISDPAQAVRDAKSKGFIK